MIENDNHFQHLKMPHIIRRRRQAFISREIKRQRREGKPQGQSVAIAFSKARKRAGLGVFLFLLFVSLAIFINSIT